MGISVYEKSDQASGSFNQGEILEKKPIGFPQDGGKLKPYSNIFYWAHAFDSLLSINFLRISLLVSLSFEATKVLIEKDLKASCTLKVATAESFLPVKGNTSGPL